VGGWRVMVWGCRKNDYGGSEIVSERYGSGVQCAAAAAAVAYALGNKWKAVNSDLSPAEDPLRFIIRSGRRRRPKLRCLYIRDSHEPHVPIVYFTYLPTTTYLTRSAAIPLNRCTG